MPSIRNSRFLLSTLLLLVTVLPLEAYSLYLRSRVLVNSGQVRMDQIARVEGEQVAGSIREKLLFARLREPRFVSREDLLKTLRADGLAPEWIYGSGVWIIPLTRKASSEDLVEMLRQQVAAHKGGEKFLKTAVFQVEKSQDYQIPEQGNLQFQLPAHLGHLHPGRRLMILAVRGKDAKGREQTVHRIHFAFTLLKRLKVPVALRDLAPGSLIGAGDYQMREVATSELKGKPLSGRLEGQRITASVSAGSVLTDSMVRDIPAVRHGQKLQLVYQNANVVIKVDSIAEGTGQVGNSIQVRPLLPSGRRGRSIEAVIVGDGLVQVKPRNGGKSQ